jgi:hypothetical protein
MPERVCAILAAKRAIRTKLDTITTTGGYTATITWTDRPANQNAPIQPPAAQGSNAVTVYGELVNESGDPDPELVQERDHVAMAVVLSVGVGDVTTMTADDYLDQLQADVQTVLMADPTQGTGNGGAVSHTQYKGFEKLRSLDGKMVAVKVNFNVIVKYPQDAPFSSL